MATVESFAPVDLVRTLMEKCRCVQTFLSANRFAPSNSVLRVKTIENANEFLRNQIDKKNTARLRRGAPKPWVNSEIELNKSNEVAILEIPESGPDSRRDWSGDHWTVTIGSTLLRLDPADVIQSISIRNGQAMLSLRSESTGPIEIRVSTDRGFDPAVRLSMLEFTNHRSDLLFS